MSQAPEPNPHHVSTWKFLVALVVVLALVGLGSWLAMRKAEKDYARRNDAPKGLGHAAPASKKKITRGVTTRPRDWVTQLLRQKIPSARPRATRIITRGPTA